MCSTAHALAERTQGATARQSFRSTTVFLQSTALTTTAKDMYNILYMSSFTEARNGLKAVLDSVINDADTTVITRRDSEDAVVMSLDYYNSLMETVHLLRSPFDGIGKPEPLKENLSGFWSRRIDDTSRLVCAADDAAITVISCHYHDKLVAAIRSLCRYLNELFLPSS